MTHIDKLAAILRDNNDGRLPNSARAALFEMTDQIVRLTERVEVLDSKIAAVVKADDTARRLTTIPGVNAIITATVQQVESGRVDRHHIKSELQQREGAAQQALEARQQAVTDSTDCRCNIGSETGS